MPARHLYSVVVALLSTTGCLLGCSSPYETAVTISGKAIVTPDMPTFSQAVLAEITPHSAMEQYVLGAVRGADSIRFDIQPDEKTEKAYVLHRHRPFTNGYAVECNDGMTCTLRFILTGRYEGAPLSAPFVVAWEASAWIKEDARFLSSKPQSIVKLQKVD